MSVDNKRVERIVEDENSRLKSIHEGIFEGILEGMREGAVSGLKRGAKDGLKECLAGGLGNVEQVDIREILDGIGEDIVRVTIRESAKNIFSKGAEIYIRGICDRIINEVQNRRAVLQEGQIDYVLNLVTKSVEEAAKRMVESLPDNPLVKEFTTGMQAALMESLEKELKSLEGQLRQQITNSS